VKSKLTFHRTPLKRSATRKTPVILQAEMADCGAACLAMVLAAYGKEVPLEAVPLCRRPARSSRFWNGAL
jgi:Peptidase C39 family